MKLIAAQVRNYHNVVDSNEMTIDEVTCLAGRNIEGKTNVLKALTKLNSTDLPDGNFFDLRRDNGQPGDLNARPENVLITRWKLMHEDLKLIGSYLSQNFIISDVVTIRKGYKNELLWNISISDDVQKSDLPAKIPDGENMQDYSEVHTVRNLLRSVRQNFDRSLFGRSKAKPCQVIQIDNRHILYGILDKQLPHFLYSAYYDILASDASLQDLVKGSITDSNTTGEKILIEWLALAGTTPDRMLGETYTADIAIRMRQIAEQFCRKIYQYWPHYSHLSFDISFTPVVTQDNSISSVDQQIRLRIKNRNSLVPESIDGARSGFLWFFSFLIRYQAAANRHYNRLVIVLDEPGLTENADSQSELLTYFNQEIRPKHQLIYSTHLLSMVDSSIFEG